MEFSIAFRVLPSLLGQLWRRLRSEFGPSVDLFQDSTGGQTDGTFHSIAIELTAKRTLLRALLDGSSSPSESVLELPYSLYRRRSVRPDGWSSSLP